MHRRMAIVTSGMSEATIYSAKNHVPDAIHVHDPFHVVKLIGEAIKRLAKRTSPGDDSREKADLTRHAQMPKR